MTETGLRKSFNYLHRFTLVHSSKCELLFRKKGLLGGWEPDPGAQTHLKGTTLVVREGLEVWKLDNIGISENSGNINREAKRVKYASGC